MFDYAYSVTEPSTSKITEIYNSLRSTKQEVNGKNKAMKAKGLGKVKGGQWRWEICYTWMHAMLTRVES